MLLLLCAIAHASESFNDRVYYFGDLHAHTGVSNDGWAVETTCVSSGPDGVVCGSIADVFDTAKDNDLDFLALTDHHNSNESSYNTLLGRVNDENDPGTFVTIPAMEMLYKRNSPSHSYGHKNYYVFSDDTTGLDFDALNANKNVRDGYCATDIWANSVTLNTNVGPTLLWAHHPASADVMTTDWYCHNQTYEPVVEVYSGWGNALTLAPDFDPSNLGSGDADAYDAPANAATVEAALETFDLHVGFVGGTDLHDTRPGMTCDRATPAMTGHVYGGGLTMISLDDSATFDRGAIYGEIVARRTFATSGPMIPVEVVWTASGDPYNVGEDIELDDTDETYVTVSVPSAYEGFVDSVRAVGYGVDYDLTETSPSPGTWTSDAIDNGDLPGWLYIEVAIDGASFYGSYDCDDGGADDDEFIWSSPVWFQVGPPPDADSDGDPDLTDCNDSDAAISTLDAEIPGNSVDEDCSTKVACFQDLDKDGYGTTITFDSNDNDCSDKPLYEATVSGDCNDASAMYKPGAVDPPHDGLDKNCNGIDA